MKRCIICIGNRFIADDSAGLAVYDKLCEMQPFGAEIDLVEGGVSGLNLLSFLENGGRVVFVDAVRRMADPGEVVVLSAKDIVSTLSQDHFGHEAGVPYLLSVLPKVCEGELPEEILLVGIEGGYTLQTIETAADLSLTLALKGMKDLA
ncbi:hydrogenase maturation protease [Desulfogranum marinum]|uniref:hydrogenase maturation protease n=1 Tax=Desulfogranum marinum TaxID=453220 RepID=UPI0019661579|nr:hydrogenase maturation protease [Desulfogranum marinum]